MNWEALEFKDKLSGRSPEFGKSNYRVQDLWDATRKPFTTRVRGRRRGQTVVNTVTVRVAPHDVVTYRLTPVADAAR